MRAFLILVLFVAPVRADVVLNEIYTNGPSHLEAPEFIETHNTGSETVDLSAWKFDDGVEFEFPAETRTAASREE